MLTAKTGTVALFLLIGLLTLRCSDQDIPDDTPSCVSQQIREFSRNGACDTGARVTQYTFQRRTIYVFDPGFTCGADMTSAVVDRDCNVLCSLGGIVGNITCNGDTLATGVTNERIIWRN